MATTTVYPDIDGVIYNNPGDSTPWSTVRSAAVSTNVDNSATTLLPYARFSLAAISRAAYQFDTTGISTGDTVDSSSFFVIADQNTSGAGMALTGMTPDTDGAQTTSDYDSLTLNSPDEFATRLTTDPALSEHEFVLNSTGISWVQSAVSGGNFSSFFVREIHDVDDNATGGTLYYYTLYASEQTGTANDPYLEVVHSAGASFTPRVMYF